MDVIDTCKDEDIKAECARDDGKDPESKTTEEKKKAKQEPRIKKGEKNRY